MSFSVCSSNKKKHIFHFLRHIGMRLSCPDASAWMMQQRDSSSLEVGFFFVTVCVGVWQNAFKIYIATLSHTINLSRSFFSPPQSPEDCFGCDGFATNFIYCFLVRRQQRRRRSNRCICHAMHATLPEPGNWEECRAGKSDQEFKFSFNYNLYAIARGVEITLPNLILRWL